ncbi:MAG: carbon-nitrogen hydrolase family protein [Thermoplasmata archaeon]
MRIALVQFTPQFPGHDHNWARMREWAETLDAEVIVFPELASSGYSYRDAEAFRPYTDTRDILDPLEHLARSRDRLFVGGFAERDGDRIYNSVFAISPSGTHVYRKMHLWANEKLLFQSGDRPRQVEFRGHRFGIEVCYDLQFPELAAYYSRAGAEAILVPTAWGVEDVGPNGGLRSYTHLAIAVAYSHGIYAAVVNRTGTEAESEFPGQSSLVDPYGRVQYLGAAEEVLRGELDFSLVAKAKRPSDLNDLDRDARLSIHFPESDREPSNAMAGPVRASRYVA